MRSVSDPDMITTTMAVPISILRSHAASILNRFCVTRNIEEALKQLQAIFKKPDYDVKYFGGNNNRLFKITDCTRGGASIIVMFSRRGISAEVALAQLSEEAVSWLPGSYETLALKSIQPSNDKPENLSQERVVFYKNNPFPKEDVECMIIMDLLQGGLTKRLDQLHQNPNHDDLLKLAVNLGAQISDLLSSLRRNKIIWTDMKPENFVLDRDCLFVGDTKTFYPVDMLPVLPAAGSDQTLYINPHFIEITPCYLSTHYNTLQHRRVTRDNALDIWDAEYSYQLGVILYKIVTNKDKYSAKLNGEEEPFDYDNENAKVFSTKQGKLLKIIIEKLCDKNPSMRIDHTHARRLLERLDNENYFNSELNTTLQREPVTGTLDPLIISRIAIKMKFTVLQEKFDSDKEFAIPNDKAAIEIYNIYTSGAPVLSCDQFDLGQDIFSGRLGKKIKHIIKSLRNNKINPRTAFNKIQKISVEADKPDSNEELLTMVRGEYQYSSDLLENIMNRTFLRQPFNSAEDCLSRLNQDDIFADLPMEAIYTRLHEFVAEMKPLVHLSTSIYSRAILNHFIGQMRKHPTWPAFLERFFPVTDAAGKISRDEFEERLAVAVLSRFLSNMQIEFSAIQIGWLVVQVELIKRLMGLSQDIKAAESSFIELHREIKVSDVDAVFKADSIIKHMCNAAENKSSLDESIDSIRSGLNRLHMKLSREDNLPVKPMFNCSSRRGRISLHNKCREILGCISEVEYLDPKAKDKTLVDEQLKATVLHKLAVIMLEYIRDHYHYRAKKKSVTKLDRFMNLYRKHPDSILEDLLKSIISLVTVAYKYIDFKKITDNETKKSYQELKKNCDILAAELLNIKVQTAKPGETAVNRLQMEEKGQMTEPVDGEDDDSIASFNKKYYQSPAKGIGVDRSAPLKNDDESSSEENESEGSSGLGFFGRVRNIVKGHKSDKRKPAKTPPLSSRSEKESEEKSKGKEKISFATDASLVANPPAHRLALGDQRPLSPAGLSFLSARSYSNNMEASAETKADRTRQRRSLDLTSTFTLNNRG